jgi:choline dehydrogenase-like flavoprotein
MIVRDGAPPDAATDPYDAVVVGSGLSGAMFAQPLVHAGLRVLMLERGDWVPRDLRNRDPAGSLELTPFFSADQTYRAANGRREATVRSCSCVGGAAVFFGGAVLRYREADFEPDPEIIGDSGARWPIRYRDLEPYYSLTEHALGVAGVSRSDPTEPPRGMPYPQQPRPLSAVSLRIAAAARALSLHPSMLPLAINYQAGPRSCAGCDRCDSYACAVGAKNDPASSVLPDLLRRGLELRPNTVAVRFETRGGEVTELTCYDRARGQWVTYRARIFALAAGSLATPHLLLASGLDRLNPGGHTVGRYLMRHCNAVVFGVFPRPLDGAAEFHKQLCFFDYYFGHPGVTHPRGKLGVLQQIHPPPPGLVQAMLPPPINRLACTVIPHMTGLVVIAEDQPRAENRVTLDHRVHDRYGLPQALIMHHYTRRDVDARRVLIRAAKRILRRAGAALFYVHPIHTFSHALGTVRMGDDPATSALDADCRFRGIENLYVVDGSALPTSAGVNPSLTLSANALRVGEHVAGILHMGAHSDQATGSAPLAGVLGLRVGNAHP